MSSCGGLDVMMKTEQKSTFKIKLWGCIAQNQSNIILRKDVKNMSNPRQVTRGLNALVAEGKLVKLGYGVYAKAYLTEYTTQPILEGGFTNAYLTALERLGIRWEESSSQKAYNSGASTQVPTQDSVRLKSRYRGKLAYENRTLIFEELVNAR